VGRIEARRGGQGCCKTPWPLFLGIGSGSGRARLTASLDQRAEVDLRVDRNTLRSRTDHCSGVIVADRPLPPEPANHFGQTFHDDIEIASAVRVPIAKNRTGPAMTNREKQSLARTCSSDRRSPPELMP
jgi:hypothetical protein